MTLAMVVFPVPAGPQMMSEESLPLSIIFRRALPGATHFCPMISSSVFGRRRCASGTRTVLKRVAMLALSIDVLFDVLFDEFHDRVEFEVRVFYVPKLFGLGPCSAWLAS